MIVVKRDVYLAGKANSIAILNTCILTLTISLLARCIRTTRTEVRVLLLLPQLCSVVDRLLLQAVYEDAVLALTPVQLASLTGFVLSEVTDALEKTCTAKG